jgi:RNA polymerase sigma factor (sigma-70 family)
MGMNDVAHVSSDIVFTAKVYNNQLVERREELGMNAKQLAAAVGICINAYHQYERMETGPYGCNGAPKATARAIADFHGLGIDVLWPQAVMELGDRANRLLSDGPLFIGEASNVFSLSNSPETHAEASELAADVTSLLTGLSERERRIIEMRFGICNREAMTWADVANIEGVSTAVIHQIVERVLRRLRFSSCSKILKPHIEH